MTSTPSAPPPLLEAECFGDALRHVRRVHRVSQRQLATWLDVPRARIGRIEAGDLRLSLADAIGLFRMLGFRIIPSHDFRCRPRPDTTVGPDDSTALRCQEWYLDGAPTYRDDAGRAFPAHGVVEPRLTPTHWGRRYSWDPGDRMPWMHDWRGPRPSLRPTGQDGAMSARTPGLRAAVEEYARRRPELESATELFVRMVRELLDDAGINYLSVTGRTKTVESFAGKAERRRDGRLLHPDPLSDITDVIGVRVITYVPDDVAAVAELLSDELAVIDDRDLGLETARSGRFGYASRHLLVGVDGSRSVPREYAPLGRLNASVQLRTVLQHAWAEFEHDIRYKGTIPEEYASDLDRRFTLAAGLIELADREFSAIRGRLRQALPEQQADPDPDLDADTGAPGGEDAPGIAGQDLTRFLADRYPDAGWSRGDHYTWVSGLLVELGITTIEELTRVLEPVDAADVIARMGYKYPPGAVRRLDDALLDRFGERYLDLAGNAHRRDALASRLEKLRRGAA